MWEMLGSNHSSYSVSKKAISLPSKTMCIFRLFFEFRRWIFDNRDLKASFVICGEDVIKTTAHLKAGGERA